MNKSNTAEPTNLDDAIGQRLRGIRETAELSRELLALRARYWGFPWSANTVALIEGGRRRLSLGEILLLPAVLNELIPAGTRLAGSLNENRHPFSYADVFPNLPPLV